MYSIFSSHMVLIKGAGDVASGIAHRLYRCGFPIVMTELPQPMVVRRKVAFASAVQENCFTIEGVNAVKENDPFNIYIHHREGNIPVVVDPEAKLVDLLKPKILIDAIMAKRNRGTFLNHAPIVIGIGPGFTAGRDVHAVVETQRGHELGKVILEGGAAPNTGVPGEVKGYAEERVLRSPSEGFFYPLKDIGSYVEKNDPVALVGSDTVKAPISGVIRGILYKEVKVKEGTKLGDIDPRGIEEYCYTISDKARAVGGGVLEAVLYLLNLKEENLDVS